MKPTKQLDRSEGSAIWHVRFTWGLELRHDKRKVGSESTECWKKKPGRPSHLPDLRGSQHRDPWQDRYVMRLFSPSSRASSCVLRSLLFFLFGAGSHDGWRLSEDGHSSARADKIPRINKRKRLSPPAELFKRVPERQQHRARREDNNNNSSTPFRLKPDDCYSGGGLSTAFLTAFHSVAKEGATWEKGETGQNIGRRALMTKKKNKTKRKVARSRAAE